MTNMPSIFAYLVFVPGEVAVERAARPVRAMIGCGPGALLGVLARIRGVQSALVFGYGLFVTDPICTFLEGHS
jgi:hypothetical protein